MGSAALAESSTETQSSWTLESFWMALSVTPPRRFQSGSSMRMFGDCWRWPKMPFISASRRRETVAAWARFLQQSKTKWNHGFSVVREFVGHGVGRRLHEEAQ